MFYLLFNIHFLPNEYQSNLLRIKLATLSVCACFEDTSRGFLVVILWVENLILTDPATDFSRKVVRQLALMSPARDSSAMFWAACISSDRVGDSNLQMYVMSFILFTPILSNYFWSTNQLNLRIYSAVAQHYLVHATCFLWVTRFIYTSTNKRSRTSRFIYTSTNKSSLILFYRSLSEIYNTSNIYTV